MKELPTAEQVNALNEGTLGGLLGVEISGVAPGLVRARLRIEPSHLAPHGYLHAGTVVGLADTACGYGCVLNLPEGAVTFATVELKANFIGTARSGVIACEAQMVHGGHSTQVWDAAVSEQMTARTIALFRCTQMLAYSLDQ